MVWQRVPAAWYEGPFLGNGRLGTTVYAEPDTDGHAIRVSVQHSEVQDHRPEFGSLWGLARLPVGHFTLEPAGAITALDWRLDLWNAELTGTVTTTAGTLALRAFTHATRDVLAVELTPDAGEKDAAWVFHPAEAVSPRAAFQPAPDGYRGNGPAALTGDQRLTAADGAGASVQRLDANGAGGHTTAWRQTARDDGTRTLYVALAHSFPAASHAGAAAAAAADAAKSPYTALAAGHRRWWHAFYPKSFVSLPDARLQAFHWIQLYKAASATRREAPVPATAGPWLEPTPWPGTWWNLNVQLESWLIHGSNHPELDSLARTLDEHRRHLVDNAGSVNPAYAKDSAGLPRTTDTVLDSGNNAAGDANTSMGEPGHATPTPEVGNLTWALHNVWLSYRHSLDESILRDTVFPLLRRAINYYLHHLAPGPDGKLHLPLTYSPEYGTATDVNYDLALIRWGCATLVDAAQLLGIDDELLPKWQDVPAALTPYPVDGTGLMIGAGQPLARSHRHYSHLLMIYPLYLMTWEDPANRELIAKSLGHWVGFTGALQGYTFTGAASIAAQMLDGDRAAGYLNQLMATYIQANTLYKESGPVIETPLSAVQSVHDMLCQSWGGVLRIFPAVPKAWRDVSLYDFRTQGAFLVSASRAGGATEWVRVHSEKGAECVLRHSIAGAVQVRNAAGQPVRYDQEDNGDLRLHLAAGEEAVVRPAGATRPDIRPRVVPPNAPAPRWGLPA